MAELPLDKIQEIIHRFEDLETKMSSNPDPETYVALASEYSELQEVVEKGRAYLSGIEEMADLRSIAADQDADDDLQDMAETELAESGEKVEQLSREIRKLLLPQDAADSKNAILEIRAGTGGSEAALFAGDLFRMYERYAANRNWGVEILSVSDGDVGGYKEIIARISGRGVFSRLKFESGVHRVQRVPETESGGRVHTSAATVAVLPEAEEVDVEIRNEDIRIDTMRASGAGGQHVNTTDSAVRITHIPSGIVVVQAEKSQHQNRARAMQILRSRLYDLERQRTDDERSEARRSQVGSGDRSERVRTYNFPQGRVTDHRINMTLYKLDRMMLGEIDEMIDGLTADFQAGQLASVGDGN